MGETRLEEASSSMSHASSERQRLESSLDHITKLHHRYATQVDRVCSEEEAAQQRMSKLTSLVMDLNRFVGEKTDSVGTDSITACLEGLSVNVSQKAAQAS